MVIDNGDGTSSATIRDRQFLFGKWGAEKTLVTFAELSKLAGYGVGDAARMLGEAPSDQLIAVFMAMMVKGIGDGIGSEPQATLKLVKKLCCDGVKCDGNDVPQATFDLFYREDLLFAFEVAQANFEVQYQSFFVRLAPVFAQLRARVQSAMKQSSSKN